MYFNILVLAPHQKLHLNLDLPAECIKKYFHLYIQSFLQAAEQNA